jgi:hypothetical protein
MVAMCRHFCASSMITVATFAVGDGEWWCLLLCAIILLDTQSKLQASDFEFVFVRISGEAALWYVVCAALMRVNECPDAEGTSIILLERQRAELSQSDDYMPAEQSYPASNCLHQLSLNFHESLVMADAFLYSGLMAVNSRHVPLFMPQQQIVDISGCVGIA